MIKQSSKLAFITDAFTKARDRYVANRYDASRESRHTSQTSGVQPSGTSADYHYESGNDLFFIAERARDLDRNHVLVGPAVDRLCTNVLQHGFEPEPDVGDADSNTLLKDKWSNFTNDKSLCDVQGEFDFNFLSYLALRESIVAGDCVGLPLKAGQIQLIESHRIRTPLRGNRMPVSDNIVHGVELDRQRRRVKYWITKDTIPLNRHVLIEDSQSFRVYDDEGNKQLFHVWHPTRSTQTRGVSKLAGTMDFARMYGDVHFARLVQQQAVSSFAFKRQRDMAFELPEDVDPDIKVELDPCAGGFEATKDMSPGMMYTTYPGESFEVLSSNVPNPTFFDHATAIETLIGINLDLPLILLKMDASETNFSGWRGAMEQAKMKFKHFQRWFALCAWHRPIYLWKLRQWTNPSSAMFDPAIAAVRAANPETFFNHEWIFPGWPYVDPQAEQQADVEAVGNSLISLRRVQRNRGRNWTRVATEIVEDKALAIELAIQTATDLNTRYPDNPEPIKWSHLVAFPRPAGDNVSASRPDETTDANEGVADVSVSEG